MLLTMKDIHAFPLNQIHLFSVKGLSSGIQIVYKNSQT